jgi:hypothetical protein
VYLEKITKLDPKVEIPIRTIEGKWAGAILPNVGIAAGTFRTFDTVHIFHDDPTALQFNLFSDSSEFFPRITGRGEYELSYRVTADNFPSIQGRFKLKLDGLLDGTTFE